MKSSRTLFRLLLVLSALCSVPAAKAATFSVSGTTLQLNLTTANEAIVITAGATDYIFALSGGTWSGTDSADATGNGTASLSAVKASFTAVTVDDSSTGNGAIFNDSGVNTYDASFTITMDSANPGGSTFNGATKFTGSAALLLQAGAVSVNPGAAISTVNGGLTLLGNMQVPTRTGSFNGVNINGATISVTGSGNLTIKGTSGISTTTQMGVRIQGATVISGGTAGSTVTIEGYGAASSGINYGLNIKDSSTTITSLGANVALKGVGGTGSSSTNHGVFLEGSTTTSAGGAGSLSVTAVAGTGGVGLSMVSGSVVSTTGTGSIAIVTDSAALAGRVSAPGRAISVAPLTPGNGMNLGSTSDVIANTLSLSQAELNTLNGGTLVMGDANTASLVFSTSITLPGTTSLNLVATTVNLAGFTATAGAVAQNGVGPSNVIVEQLGTALASGGTVSHGTVPQGTNADAVITLRNNGFADLTGISLSIDGVNADEFTVFASPATSLVPGSSTTFTIRFAPTAFGVRRALLHIASSDPDQNPFDINLSTEVFSSIKSVGPTGDYASLTAAIADIQANALTSSRLLELQPTYLGSVETFPLTVPALNGASATNTLTIRPASGATGLSLSSADTTAATVDLNGAQFVTFDGRPGGVGTAKQLTIENTSTAGVALRFINEGSNNTLKFVTFRGVNTSATSGTVVFSSSTGANGNNNNTIDTCDIRDGASTPANGIFSSGTTTTTAQNNSGNTVTNCNIFNFYSATAASSGVLLAGGSTDWTISGNSFYQTATRTAVSQTFSPILIDNTAGNNFTVTGNFIGGDSPGAAVTAQKWTTTGFLAYNFRGIRLNVGSTTASSVQGNTIANIVWTFASNASTLPGVWSGIYVQAGNVNIGTVTGNTIGSGTGTGSISFTGSGSTGTIFGIGSASNGSVAIANNTIGSITGNGSSTANNNSLVGIQVTAGANTISNNVVGSTTTANSLNAATSPGNITNGQHVTGILSSSGTSASITGNTVANLNNNYANAATSGQIRGIVTTAGVNTITGNTVRNLSTTSQNTNTISQSVVGISQTSTTAGQSVSQNTVHSLANTAATAAVSVTGIYFAGPTSGTNVIARNFVHSLAVSSSSTTSQLKGMEFAAGTFTAQNNMVRVGLKEDGTNTAGVSVIYGILDNGTTAGRNFYHNSVYVGGTQTSNSASTYALRSTGVSNARTYQNNISVNARSNSGATSKHYAVSYGGTTVNPTGLTAGGNLLLASGAGGALGFYNNADLTTLAAWQAAIGHDATSAVADPLFVNPTGDAGTVDLHLQASNPAESQGLPITAVTDDFDGQTRGPLTPVDVGADAGSFTLSSDVFAPRISYPPLSNGSAANRVLTGWATITDAVGVSGGASAPRLYFKKGTDADVFAVANDSTGNGWKYVTATGSGPYSFTLDYSLINGGSVVNGDTVQYFVVAQDAADNFGSSPVAATASVNPPVQNLSAKPAAGVNSFSIVGSISGTKTVGTGGDYPSLSGPGGLFAALNASVLTGDMTVGVTSDLTETGGVTLNPLALNGTATYTLTLQPDSATMRTISGNTTGALITLNGADGVTLDGRFGGSGRFLTFRNLSTSSTSSSILFQNDASNNTIRNCVIEGASTNTSLGVIGFGTGTVTGNNNNLITGCQVRDRSDAAGVPSVLIGSTGSAGFPNTGNTVSNNELFNFNFTGIAINSPGNASWTISGNELYQVATRSASTAINLNAGGTNLLERNYLHDLRTSSSQGIGIIFNGGSSTTIAGNRITALNVEAATSSLYGILAQGAAGSTLNVVNNQITLSPASAGTRTIVGLYDFSSSGAVVNVFHNSIVLGGTETASLNSWSSYRNAASTHTARNNLFLNLRTGGTGSHFAAGIENAAGTYAASHNVYAGTGATAGNFMDFNPASNALAVSFASWQASTGDTSSQAGIAGSGLFTAAMFVGAANGDLHLIPGGNVLVNSAGTPIAGVTTDYDGETRSTTAPCIGADEIITLTPFEQWAIANGVSTDPNANGGENLKAFAFGYRPGASGALVLNGTLAAGGTIGSTGTPITMFAPSGNGVDFRALFVRRKDYAGAGLTYTPQFSADMTTWVNSAAVPVVLADDGTHQIVSVPYPPFVGGKKARFFRISVSIAP